MSRKTVRVEVHTGSPEDLIKLGTAVGAKHAEDGAASPLDKDKMTKLAAVIVLAAAQNQAASDADAVAQKARQARDVALGIARGQNSETKGTGLNLITYARDQLLVSNEGMEKALESYGFTVVVGAAKSPAARTKVKAA